MKTGPTSNFVGNHMTQGAIDLVQAHLQQPARAALLLGGGGPQPPRLLGTSGADAAAAGATAAARPLQQYCWLDAGGCVRVEVPVAQLQQDGAAACATVTCSIQADRLDLQVCAPSATTEDSTSSAAPGASSVANGSAVGTCHRLLLHPLHAAVVPAGCRCYAKGLPALPPGLPRSNSDSAEQPAPAAPRDEGSSQAAISFSLPPGATHIVVELHKADAQQEWPALQASGALAAPAATGGPSEAGPPDVAALR